MLARSRHWVRLFPGDYTPFNFYQLRDTIPEGLSRKQLSCQLLQQSFHLPRRGVPPELGGSAGTSLAGLLLDGAPR